MSKTNEVPSPMEMLSSRVRQIITKAVIRPRQLTPVVPTLTPPAMISALPTQGACGMSTRSLKFIASKTRLLVLHSKTTLPQASSF